MHSPQTVRLKRERQSRYFVATRQYGFRRGGKDRFRNSAVRSECVCCQWSWVFWSWLKKKHSQKYLRGHNRHARILSALYKRKAPESVKEKCSSEGYSFATLRYNNIAMLSWSISLKDRNSAVYQLYRPGRNGHTTD
jgi:hypothetical protein